MYTESLNENYIFCVKSIIQVVNKSEQIILLLCPAFSVVSDPSRSGWPRLVRAPSVKSPRKDVSCSPRLSIWETLRRLNVWFTSCQWPEWLGFEMKSVKYFGHRGPLAILHSEGGPVAFMRSFLVYVSEKDCLMYCYVLSYLSQTKYFACVFF